MIFTMPEMGLWNAFRNRASKFGGRVKNFVANNGDTIGKLAGVGLDLVSKYAPGGSMVKGIAQGISKAVLKNKEFSNKHQALAKIASGVTGVTDKMPALAPASTSSGYSLNPTGNRKFKGKGALSW